MICLAIMNFLTSINVITGVLRLTSRCQQGELGRLGEVLLIIEF